MIIYIPKNASAVEKNAAEELSQYLEKAYGVSFSICTETDGEFGLYVGFTEYALSRHICPNSCMDERNGAESWIVCSVDGSLVLTGGRKNTDRGILYAVEHYLEDVVGVRFWNALEEYVPQLTSFSVPTDLCIQGEPEFVMRNSSAGSYFGTNPLFFVRHRNNYLMIPEEWGGGIQCSPRGHCHTTIGILPPQGLFDRHPDWFAWSESMQRRLPYGQYCLNNEEFLQAFERAFIADIEKIYADCDAAGKSRPHHFHISLDDNAFDCECPVCKERMQNAGYTGNVLRFVNRMAQAAEKVYPGVLVETLAYWTYMDPPLDDTVPEKNVIVRLADLDIDILHSLHHPNNARALEVLVRWSEICKKSGSLLYIWDYNVIYTGTLTPNVSRLSENFRTYSEYGVSSVYMEHEEPILTDFWGLKHWLLLHLMEDPHADCDALTEEYMHLYYGAAAPILKQWLALEEAATAASPLYMCCVRNFIKADHIPYELYIEGNRLFAEAEHAVRGNAILMRRVRQARASLDLSVCLRYDSLVFEAKKRGEVFPIPREEAGLRYALTVHETVLQLKEGCPSGLDGGFSHWQGCRPMAQWQTPYTEAPIPEEFAGKEVLQVSLSDYVILNSGQMGVIHLQDDESISGYAACLDLEQAPDYILDEACVRSKADPGLPYTMVLDHRGQVTKKSFTLEDLSPDRYALYHAFDIDDLSEDSNTLFRIVYSVLSLHLSGFAKILPGKKLSVWLRMKFSGKMYGGSKDKKDQISLDRMYLVVRD